MKEVAGQVTTGDLAMAKKLKWEVTVSRPTKRLLSPSSLKSQLDTLAATFCTRGMECKTPKTDDPTPNSEGYTYKATFVVTRDNYRNEDSAKQLFEKQKGLFLKRAHTKGWEVEGGIETTNEKPKGPPIIRQNLEIELPPLTDEVMETYFGRLYERDPQIRTIYKSIEMACRTGFRKRSHTLLYGLPACAKSEIFKCYANWLNSTQPEPMVVELDATTMTKAGLERMMMEMAEEGNLPPIWRLEEIEKTDMNNLNALHQVMTEGKIQRTNCRQQGYNNEQTARVLIWATCNDLDAVKEHKGAAIASRFSHQLYCSRPTRQLMKQILQREIREMNISPASSVVEKVLDFGFEEMKTSDPRFFIALLEGWDNIDKYLDDQRSMWAARVRDMELKAERNEIEHIRLVG